MENYTQVKRKEEKQFIENMIFLRESKGWTQTVICDRINHNLNFKTYQAWEERRAFPPIAFCRLIADLFNTDLETMLTTSFRKAAA